MPCISSVLAQKYRSFEILVIDDASSDNTAELVEGISSTTIDIRCIRLPTNSGTPARPRNVGVMNARYEVIAFLDADDAWDSCHLEMSLRTMRDFSCHFVTSCVLASNSAAHIFKRCPPTGTVISLRSLLWSNSVVTSSVVVDIRQIPVGLAFPEKFDIYEDYAQWLTLAAEIPLRSTGHQTTLYSRSGLNKMSLTRSRRLKSTYNTFRHFFSRVNNRSITELIVLTLIALLSISRLFIGELLRNVKITVKTVTRIKR